MRAKAEMENQLLEAVAKGIKVDIPEVMVDDQIDYQIQQMSYQLMYQGMKLDDYLKYMGKTLQDLRNDYKESAQEQVRMRLAVEALLKKLEIDPSEEDIEKKYEELAKDANKTVQEFKDTMSTQEIDYFKERVAMEQLFDYLVSKAEIEEVDPKKEAAEQKKASKDSAKKEPAKDSDKKTAKKAAEKDADKPKAAKE